MGLNVSAWQDERRNNLEYGFSSQRQCGVDINIYSSSFAGRWPEIVLKMQHPHREEGSSDTKHHAKFMSVRIHGVTMRAMMAEMVKDKVLFDFLASAVDHLRANPGAFEGAR